MSAHSQPVSHYLVLDVFRFVAALGVMLAHYGLVIVLRTGGSIPDFIDRFHLLVDFFFILSGFVIALHYDGRIASAHDYADYMRRRLARIYPLHLLTLLLTVLIFALGVSVGMPVRDPARFDFSALPSHFMLTHAFSLTRALTFNVPSWSLSAEFLVYLLFPLLALIARRGIVTVAAFVVIYVSGLIALRDWLGLGSWTRGDFDLGALRAVPSFLAGITIARLVKAREGVALPWPLVLVFAAQ
ncbi:MAG: acyltransferase family protein, partial [Beijerinckiaceae bacterium]